jgi:hypothetical protein
MAPNVRSTLPWGEAMFGGEAAGEGRRHPTPSMFSYSPSLLVFFFYMYIPFRLL